MDMLSHLRAVPDHCTPTLAFAHNSIAPFEFECSLCIMLIYIYSIVNACVFPQLSHNTVVICELYLLFLSSLL